MPRGAVGLGGQAADGIGATVRVAGGKKYSVLPPEIYTHNNDRAALFMPPV
jgi:hypothetical protein